MSIDAVGNDFEVFPIPNWEGSANAGNACREWRSNIAFQGKANGALGDGVS